MGAIEAGYAVGVTGYAIHHVLCQTIVRVGEVAHAPTYGVMLPFTLEFLKIRDAQAWETVAEAMDVPDPSSALARVCAEAGLATNLSGLGVAPERLDVDRGRSVHPGRARAHPGLGRRRRAAHAA